ncbi:hypothetical protein BHE74_00025510, partial [Ensete ventricosum]
ETHRETRRKLVKGIGSLSGVRRKLAEGIGSLPGVHRKLTKVSGGYLAEGDREFTRKVSGVSRKKTKKLVERSSGVAEKLVRSHEGLAGLDGHIGCID